jgi:Leucine-rich repeat (LRR) protein
MVRYFAIFIISALISLGCSKNNLKNNLKISRVGDIYALINMSVDVDEPTKTASYIASDHGGLISLENGDKIAVDLRGFQPSLASIILKKHLGDVNSITTSMHLLCKEKVKKQILANKKLMLFSIVQDPVNYKSSDFSCLNHYKDFPIYFVFSGGDNFINEDTFASMKNFKNLKGIILHNHSFKYKVTDGALSFIKNKKSLEILALHNSIITDASAKYFKTLTNLKILDISNTQIGDKFFEDIDSLKNLEELYLGGTTITDNAFTFISKLKTLHTLSIDSWKTSQHENHINKSFNRFLSDFARFETADCGESGHCMAGYIRKDWVSLGSGKFVSPRLRRIGSSISINTKLTSSLISFLKPLKKLKIVNFRYSNFSLKESNIAILKKLPLLDTLHLPNLDNKIAEVLIQLKHLKNLIIYNNNLTGVGLAHLSEIDLHSLKLEITSSINPAHFSHLNSMKNLKSLYVYGSNITKEFFDAIKPLSTLTKLIVLNYNSKIVIPTSAISNISSFINLKELSLFNLQLTTPALAHLKSLQNLVILSLPGNKIESLQHIGTLKNLQYLDVRYNNISDDGFRIQRLKKLRFLLAGSNKLSPDAIIFLSKMDKLRFLDFSMNSKIDRTVFYRLKKAKNLVYLNLLGCSFTNKDMNNIKGHQNIKYLQYKKLKWYRESNKEFFNKLNLNDNVFQHWLYTN